MGREAGENYLAKTQEVSTAAYEGAKPYVCKAAEKTQEASVAAYEGAKPYVIAAGEKTVEVSKDLYAKIMALLFPDRELLKLSLKMPLNQLSTKSLSTSSPTILNSSTESFRRNLRKRPTRPLST